MEIRYKDIVLRDLIESDIDDWIRWDSIETEYMNWDGPDKPIEPINPDEYRREMLEFLSAPRDEGFRNFFELATSDGHHIGRINSYALGPDSASIRWPESTNEQSFTAAIGIDICDSRFWGRGLGRQAITAFVRHFLNHGISDICLQTWSGNLRMIRCAQRIGFVECSRIVGNRHIRGGIYDSLTFRLDLDTFHKFLSQNS